jgi:hypothetical protein
MVGDFHHPFGVFTYHACPNPAVFELSGDFPRIARG